MKKVIKMDKEKIEFKIKGYELIERETEWDDKEMKHLMIEVPEYWEDAVVALVRLND